MKKILGSVVISAFCMLGIQHTLYAEEVETNEVETVSTQQTVEQSEEMDVQTETVEEPTIIVQETKEEVQKKNGIVKENNAYVIYNDDKIQNYTGFRKVDGIQQSIFFRNGKQDTTFTGVAKAQDGKYYFARKGLMNFTFTGVAKNVENGQWYHVNKGKWDTSFTGLSKSVENGKWYFSRKGILDWSFTGVAKSIENGKWYHAKKGSLDWKFTGLSKSVENGKWYFTRKGALDWKFTGLSKSVENGKWYHSKNGSLDWNFTGLSKSVDNGKYFYSKKGSLDWNYYGKATNIDNKKIYGVAAGRQFNDSKSLANILSSIQAPSLNQLKKLARDYYGMDDRSFTIALGWLAGDNLQGQDDYASYLSACAPINAFRKSGSARFVSEYTSWGSYYAYGRYVSRANNANSYIRKVMLVALTNLDTRPTEANGMCVENGYNAHSISSAIYKVRYRSSHILPYGGYEGWFGVWSY